MKVTLRPGSRRACLLPAMVLGFATLAYSAPPAATAPATASAPAKYTPEQKAAMDTLDGALARYETLVNRDDDAKHKAADQAVLDGFKQRRAALAQAYDQGHYDDLRVDLNLEYQRLASWMAPPTTPPSVPKAEHPSENSIPQLPPRRQRPHRSQCLARCLGSQVQATGSRSCGPYRSRLSRVRTKVASRPSMMTTALPDL